MREKGINQDNVQQINRTLVIRWLRKKGVCSRAELAQLTRLQPATITNIINEFQQMGLVKEAGSIKEGRGRRAIGISLNSVDYSIIGIRLSRKYFLTGLFDLNGCEIVSRSCDISKEQTQEEIFEEVKREIDILIEENNSQVLGIGCAVPGPFLRKRKVALKTEFPDWENIHIKKELEKRYNIPVFVERDANVGALSCYWDLGAEPSQLLIYFSAGQGIGAGIVSDGVLLIGALGAAGEIGHMSINVNGPLCGCGNKGCLEKYCSSIALTHSLHKKIAEDNDTALYAGCSFTEIKKAVQQKDKLATEEYKKCCDYFAVGIVNIINILNPDTIVVGDEMASVEPDILLGAINAAAEEKIHPDIWENMKITICKEKNNTILRGASILAAEEMFKKPLGVIK